MPKGMNGLMRLAPGLALALLLLLVVPGAVVPGGLLLTGSGGDGSAASAAVAAVASKENSWMVPSESAAHRRVPWMEGHKGGRGGGTYIK